jgi:hypothetical protein
LKELDSAEACVDVVLLVARELGQAPPVGGSPFASATAGPSYAEAGRSAADAVEATKKVLGYYREGIEAAMKNYRQLDDDAASSFGSKA